MIKAWYIATILTLILASCGGDAGSESGAATPGQALYEVNCGTCHGDRGLGDGPLAETLPVVPPSLLDHLGHHPEAQLLQIIMTGVPPAMPPAPLTEDEVRLVVDYAWTLVPDSLVEGLREMQRMAEMGMPMDSGGSMPPMRADSSGGGMGTMARDTTGG